MRSATEALDSPDGMSGWLPDGTGPATYAWPGQVLHIGLPDGWDSVAELSDVDEQQAIAVLFQFLDEFAAERELSEKASLG
ncbi:hypothetical protein ACFQ71_07715 [Streptomyces sp. NPDC056534]|uniref:hypothetical protein n=1 Tax=Streptomyces sp. NPDC056534 TaxID=3345857 RepID=UPI0036C44214